MPARAAAASVRAHAVWSIDKVTLRVAILFIVPIGVTIHCGRTLPTAWGVTKQTVHRKHRSRGMAEDPVASGSVRTAGG